MTTDAIFQKYAIALVDIGADTLKLSGDAVLLALRLAIGDAYDAGSAVAADLVAIVAEQATPERSPADQRYAEQLQAQISRLNEWLEKYAPALYHNPDIDTAAAVLMELGMLRRQISQQIDDKHEDLVSARQELVTLIAERDGLRQQLAQMDADNADLLNKVQQAQVEIDRLTRQDVNPTPAALPATDWGRNHPAWEALPKADLAVIDQLSSGTTTFRRINKSLRRDLVCRAIRHLASEHGGPLPSSVWDRNRPLWLPTQGAVNMLSDGGNWSSLLAMALEPA